MNPFEKLRNIFEGKFRDVFANNKFVLFDFSHNSNSVVEVKKQDVLSIDLGKATLEEKKAIKEIVEYSIQQDEALLRKEEKALTEKIHHNLPLREDNELLDFYKGKLVPEMHQALEAALILRRMKESGESIDDFKAKIARRYPLFGNNLCNMVSQGYFHDHFKQLYQSMQSEPDFDIEKYRSKVLKIVVESPYTVFITRHKTYDEMSGKVRFKLQKLKAYGTGKLAIHGLGKENVATTKLILDEYKNDNSVQIEIDPDSTSTIITAYLKF